MKNTIRTHKWQDLIQVLKKLNSVAIACSGGLDSRLLTYAAKQGHIDYKILHLQGPHIPQVEEIILQDFAQFYNIKIESYYFNPLTLSEVLANSEKRCYFCKKAIFSLFKEKAQGFILCDGTNTDDLTVYRPGLQALKELQVHSPFAEVGISKEDIQYFAKFFKLPYYDQKSQACLITRFNYGISPTEADLIFIDKTESLLNSLLLEHNIQEKPLRVRALEENKWEIHIQCTENEQLKQLFAPYIQNIPLIFTENIRGYFDKNGALA